MCIKKYTLPYFLFIYKVLIKCYYNTIKIYGGIYGGWLYI